jgi:hypothetical protein
VVRELEGKRLEVFSRLQDFVEENSVETSDTGIVQCIQDHLVHLQSRFSKYLPEAVGDKYIWIKGPVHAVQRSNHIRSTDPGIKRVFYFSQIKCI